MLTVKMGWRERYNNFPAMAPYSRSREELRSFSRKHRKNPTKAEALLWEELRRKRLGLVAHRQRTLCGYIADFYMPKALLVIEVDGEYHDDRKSYDRHRDEVLHQAGFFVMRVTNRQIYENMDGVISSINVMIGERLGKPL